ncbi:MAG: AsmA family protein [Magnetovibrio sp.]|nr:AsmA family protein [Magnetovibrio sp.]
MFALFRRLISISVKLGLLAGGIGVIIGYANLSDVEGWKRDLQDEVMRISGRRLHIDGPIDFKIPMPPRIVDEGVRLQNAPWGSKKDMLKAKALVAEVDLLPLMVGDMAVPRLRLVGADILVEIGKSGRSNWDELNSFETAAGGASSGANAPIFSPALSSGISVAGGTVTVSDAATGTATTFALPATSIDVAAGLPCL